MSKRKFRKIIVNEQAFHWLFDSTIKIRPDNNPQNKLEIDFGYYDSWLYMNDKENEPEDYNPKVITPVFIRKCIENAIKLGWNTELKHGIYKLKYRNNKFLIDNSNEINKR